MSHTFLVSDVKINRERHTALDRDAALRKLLHQPVEALSLSRDPTTKRLIECTDGNAFAAAAQTAFYDHCPLSLSPDAVWLCLARGFAEHVNLHAEELRKRFVKHEGKIKLVVERPDFALGQPNPWHEAFAAFSDQIAAHVGKLRDLVVADFSTTTITERAASEVVLMDGFQAYFEYEMMCGCGIPSITLLGTRADWRSIRARAAVFSEFGPALERWTRALLPVLDEFVRAAEGAPNIPFWQSFFRYRSGSGPSVLTGWIHVLFPHILADGTTKKLKPNPYLETWSENWQRDEEQIKRNVRNYQERLGPGIGELPASLSSAPVKITDLYANKVHEMRFVAGMFGVNEDVETGAVSPEIAWAVVYGNEKGKAWDWRNPKKAEAAVAADISDIRDQVDEVLSRTRAAPK